MLRYMKWAQFPVALVSGMAMAPAQAEVDSTYLGAEDAKIYSAALCGASRFSDLSITRNGLAQNISTTRSLDVTCALPRDLTNTFAMKVTVWVSKSTSDAMTCTLTARKVDNSGGAVTTATISGSGNQMAVLGPLSLQGTYSLSCNLLPAISSTNGRNAIVSIQTLESN